MGNKAIFLDRDGVINNNANHYYIYRNDQLEINPGVKEAIAEMCKASYLVIVISNQGGIAKGLYTKSDVDILHEKIASEIKKHGGEIVDFFYCPHHHSLEKCLCTKPSPLMIERAISRYHIDPKKSFLIGDSNRDIEAGNAAGIESHKIKPNENLFDFIVNYTKILH